MIKRQNKQTLVFMKSIILLVILIILATFNVFSQAAVTPDSVYVSSLVDEERKGLKKGDYLMAIDGLNTLLYCDKETVTSWGFVEVYNGTTDTLYQYVCVYNGAPIVKLESTKDRN